MRLVSFETKGQERAGLVLSDGRVVDLYETALDLAATGQFPGGTAGCEALKTVPGIIAVCAAVLPSLRLIESEGEQGRGTLIEAGDYGLLAPIPRPYKNVFCVGRNYIDHVTEGYKARGSEIRVPEHPQFFSKPPTAVTGPHSDIPFDPKTMARLDYEVELGVIIGMQGKDIPQESALDHVFGYTIINDLTARDLQRKHDQWFKGKGLDFSCPMGPWIVHKDDIADPQDLAISLSVNGEVRQQARTSQMIFDLKRIISDLSQGMTLEVGDIIATGTPSGVGYAMASPSFLSPGDVVRCEIECIGAIENRIGVTQR
ncbi:fumarylacetoacetate hydrolase family protein [Paraburkholderia sp. RP-4-7]|uniref:Fumarylacetoacetate hydrolase family protein n=2 Tax=Paraburkholderia polaris TaxID=2728848 RepID=A0A848ITK7_9BURK|nr:fumarylacetoacetate hydrolase family protein [Paraburkholderia polaris]